MAKHVRILHRATGATIAEGPRGWGITPFEGNYYVRRRYLRDGKFVTSFVPGLCPYKFIYLWLHWEYEQTRVSLLGWRYIIANPLFPFVWWRVAVPGSHPELIVETTSVDTTAD